MTARSRIRWFPQRSPGCLPATTRCRFDPLDFSPPIRTRLLILQPTPFCNIDCDYCYLPARNSAARMGLATVRRAAERLRDDGLAADELTIVWHAGEPLTMPKDFYDEAAAVLHDVLAPLCVLSHSIQTNATLVDDAWCELFMRHNMRIGVSVDGPAALHDLHRRTRDHRGTHAAVMRGMACLRAHAIPFHAIAVVGPATFANADAFLDFFIEQGVSELCCNYDEAEGTHHNSSLDGHEEAHAAFVARLLERAYGRAGGQRVRELEMAFQLIAQPLPTYRWHRQDWPENAQTQPFALISVAHNGDFSTFSPELLGQPSAEFGNFVLGNVATDGFFDSARGLRFQRLWDAIVRGTRACEASCAHYGFCGGGAPANKLYENGDFASAETLYCRTMLKRPFDAVLARLEYEAVSGRARLTAHGG
ncbi:cyclophane-forming radical SAM/SPASM peptide maturase GrrM/OscB [Accumulibacter sp.]|uniref:cyclophane-forming radical SAM/SPASM peptide maturase GrrM/OscB n=1 Tax=Accumulibacter sp. TaxID=2053492 RepID=UPI0035B34323